MTNPMTTETLAERLAKCVRTVAWEAGERDQRRAYTPLGELVVTFFGGKWHHAGLPCATMLEAQSAAQADYTARILAALDIDAIARLVAEAVEKERGRIDFRHAQELVAAEVKNSLARQNAKKMADLAEAEREKWRKLNMRLNAALARADKAEKALAAARADRQTEGE